MFRKIAGGLTALALLLPEMGAHAGGLWLYEMGTPDVGTASALPAALRDCYGFSRGAWGALDATYFTGGRTRTDGIKDVDAQENTRVGATLALSGRR